MTRLHLALGCAGALALVLAALLIGQARLGRELADCRAEGARLAAALALQNAAVSAMRAEGEARGRALSATLEAAEDEARSADRRAARIAAIEPAGADACARLLDVDRKIMRTR